MKIYLITFNKCSYDQYDAFVVVAKNKEHAISLLTDKYPNTPFGIIQWDAGYEIDELKLEKPEIILGSYNAG